MLSRHGIVSTIDAGLRYLLSDPQVGMLLSGVATVEELATSVAVSDGQFLSPELIAEIEAV